MNELQYWTSKMLRGVDRQMTLEAVGSSLCYGNVITNEQINE